MMLSEMTSLPAANAATEPPAAPLGPWAAPTVDGPVCAVVVVPGSKSATNRALILAAQSPERCRLGAPLRSRDTVLMTNGLRRLGVQFWDDGESWELEAAGFGTTADDEAEPGRAEIDCGNAGTVARFLPPLAATTTIHTGFDGDPRMRERPLRPLLDALRELGAQIDDGGRGGMPLRLRGPLRGGAVTVNAATSSQLVSGLLLSGPSMTQGLELRHNGPALPSAHHLTMTVRALRAAGATVECIGEDPMDRSWRVAPGPIQQPDETIEPDLSTASAFLAAAAATGGRVTVAGWPNDTAQPGQLLPDLLRSMGCVVTLGPDGLTVSGPDELVGIDVDLHEYGEVAPTLTALAVLANSRSRLRGIAHLRLQETDRLAGLAQELGRLGAKVEVTEDGLVITPAVLHGGVMLDPQADHRLAMAYAIVGLRVPGVSVDDIATTGKTVPDFPALWAQMLAV